MAKDSKSKKEEKKGQLKHDNMKQTTTLKHDDMPKRLDRPAPFNLARVAT